MKKDSQEKRRVNNCSKLRKENKKGKLTMGFLDKMGINMNVGGNKDPLSLAEENIRNAEMEIEQAMLNLGKMIYEEYEKGNKELKGLEAENSEYRGLISKILMTKANREAYYKNHLQLQGLMECVNCRSKIPFGSVFCSTCGCKTSEVDENFVPDFSFCTNCGEKVNKDSAFCTNCGNKM